MHSPSVAFLPLPNFTLTPFAGLMDMLRLAADEGDGSRPVKLRWSVIGVDGAPVRSSCGVEIQPWEGLGAPARFDYIIVCGGLLRRTHGSDLQIEAYLRAAAAAGATIVGLCTGVFMLAQAGLLAGRRACVSWFHLADFQAQFPDARPDATQLYAVDGPVITCAGGTGAVDVGALIVERRLGPAAAKKALHILVVDAARPASFPQPQPAFAEAIADLRIRRAALAIEQNLGAALSVPALARQAGLSRRQFERLFGAETGFSPAAFIAAMRLRYADWLVRTTDRPLTEIAETCGFSDSAHLSRRYRAKHGRAPSTARQAGGFSHGERRPYTRSNGARP